MKTMEEKILKLLKKVKKDLRSIEKEIWCSDEISRTATDAKDTLKLAIQYVKQSEITEIEDEDTCDGCGGIVESEYLTVVESGEQLCDDCYEEERE
jgi:hypothetical protein